MSNFDDFLNELRDKTELDEILKKYGLSRILIYNIIKLAKEGKSDIEIAQTLAIHLATVKRYSKKFRTMKESEANRILRMFQKGRE